jgi:ATPase family protein associated with various cellular activities (AAA)
MTLLSHFAAARRAGAPLIAIRTPDPAATIAAITASYNGTAPPVITWDCVTGFKGANEAGADAMQYVDSETTDPLSAINVCAKFAQRTLIFAHQLPAFLGDPGVRQAVANLRDAYKADHRTLVMLCADVTLPAELAHDVLIMDEQLPNAAALAAIIQECHEGAELPQPEAPVLARAVDALAGLAAFPAEQAVAMSLTPQGLDVAALWTRKRQTITQTRGLSCPEPKGDFSSLGGLENIKGYLRRLIQGPRRPKVVVLVDEIEKGMAGATGGGAMDGGVSQDALQVFLTRMQERDYLGTLWPGVPGAGKSALAQATAAEAECPLIWFDLGATKGGIVGESEANIRRAFSVIDAVGGDSVLIIATCNRMATLPPELKRRFQLGTFYFDLPTAEEQAAIWPLYTKAYALSHDAAPIHATKGTLVVPDCNGWTGAEIRTCCQTAHLLGCNLTEAASYIVPVARAAADTIERLRTEADGRYLSASTPGVYRKPSPTAAAAGPRRIEVS